MSLLFYALGIITGVAAYWFVLQTSPEPDNGPWLLVNGEAFNDLGAACEFADWLESHGRQIEFCVRAGCNAGAWSLKNKG